MKSLQLLCLAAIAAAGLHAASNPVYWSTDPNLDCSQVYGPYEIDDSHGNLVGYSCEVAGTFNWLAAGGGWGSEIRVSAPSTADIGADFWFYNAAGNTLDVDSNFGPGTQTGDQSELSFSLYANQPAVVSVLGAHSNPSHSQTQTGTVWVSFYCPDQYTCLDVLPQLLYSDLPGLPWTLSVPVVWDNSTWPTYSAVGIDDASSHRVSFVVYNEDVEPSTSPVKTAFDVLIYDDNGNLYDVGTTPQLLPIPQYADSTFGEGQTYGDLLSNVVSIPDGPFKVAVDGGSVYCAAEFLQFNANAAAGLQTAYDESTTLNAAVRSSGVSSRVSTARRPTVARLRSSAKSRIAFLPAPKAKK